MGVIVIEEVFEELRRSGVVRTGARFSADWLGMEESYFRCLRAKGRNPSVKALATCAVRLRRRAALLEGSSLPQVRQHAGRYSDLADRCLNELLLSCERA